MKDGLVRGMIRKIAALAVLALAAACGVDGPPQPPEKTVVPGVSVSGDARIGMRGDW